jgi:hypothetical protein
MSSGADACLAQLQAAARPLLASPHAPAVAKAHAMGVIDAPDMVPAAEAYIPLILALEEAAEALASAEKRLRDVLATVMSETGCTTLRSPDGSHTASVSDGRASVQITDANALPPDLMRQPPPAPDKAAIAKLLKQGVAVAGAVLGNSPPTLSIRARSA